MTPQEMIREELRQMARRIGIFRLKNHCEHDYAMGRAAGKHEAAKRLMDRAQEIAPFTETAEDCRARGGCK